MSKQFKLGVITAQDISPLCKNKLPHPTVMANESLVSQVDELPEEFHLDYTPHHEYNEYVDLGDLPVDSSISDFWNEVKSTHAEAPVTSSVTSVADTDDELRQLSQSLSEGHEHAHAHAHAHTGSDTSLEDFLNHEDLDNDIVTPTQEVKLLCLRDSKGKFTLKTTERSKKNKVKKNKKNKVLRRKSGVCAMISTGIGINEFML
ncbi:uncharacterized protein HLK63_K01001 [Nakaseomyces glabratus]|nr:uncharacterized protein GW608_K01001 [Nakaseomyces glabratus]UCS27307.1 uncharacterized protein HLK63_K01001 [Nakaseomyces glabratus]UCS32536.1 uncharacterized protein HLK64_K01001 [Nakaseomyces glabratus]UCS37765.1 uncharacterized protein HLK62_K01001 [Nakaseomyces glabratus]